MTNSLEEFSALPPKRQLKELARILREQADRCTGNALLAGTWVQGTFNGAAERCDEIAGKIRGKAR